MIEQHIDDVGPVFPKGMSRRNYLAAHAPRHVCAEIMCRFTDFADYQTAYARAAYIYADAMIARSSTTKGTG